MQALLDDLSDRVPEEELDAFGTVLGILGDDPLLSERPQKWDTYAAPSVRFGR